jgi:hypothetical protein
MLIFLGLIKTPQDVATVAGSLGGLYTLIGTVAGAYFGIKSTQDTTDKAARQVEDANARAERASDRARLAHGRLNPQDPVVDNLLERERGDLPNR